MGKNKKTKKKDQRKTTKVNPDEPSLADVSLTWRGGTERKPLTPYPNNSPGSSAITTTPTILKRPVIQGFGPAWIHNSNNTEGVPDAHLDKDNKQALALGQALIPVPNANSCAESLFKINIHNDVSILKHPFEMKNESELPPPMANFSPSEPRPKGYYSYFSPWNARNNAHKIKSNFLSFLLACNELSSGSVGNVDFISDVENIKRIMQMKKSHQYESFICHRIGNTVLVDKFDLQSLYWKCTNEFWPWFEIYARKVIGVENENVKNQNSYSVIRSMEALHVFFYSCLKEVIRVEPVPVLEENDMNKFRRNPFPIPAEGTEGFLRRFRFNIDNFVLGLGSTIPIFSKEDSKVTLRTHNGNENLTKSDLTDIYLEQLLLGVDETYVAHHENMIFKRSEWLSKNTLLNGAGILKSDVIRDGIDMLQLLKEKVVESSHTYWLFKAPGKEHVLVDLNLKMQEEEENDPSPFGFPYASLLYRYVETFHKVVKTDVGMSMLSHAEDILNRNGIEIDKSIGLLKTYLGIRKDLRLQRPDISDPRDTDANYKIFDYRWEKQVPLADSPSTTKLD